MKKFIKFGIIPVVAVIMMAAFSACNEKEDVTDAPGSYYYYITCTNVACADMTSQECTALQNELNRDCAELDINSSTQAEAIEIFDMFMHELARELSYLSPSSPLKITFALKSTNGIILKTSTLTLSKNGADVSRCIYTIE